MIDLTALDPTVQVAIVTGLIGLLGGLLEKIRRTGKANRNQLEALREDAAATRFHVQNDHTTNLREDLDRVIVGVDHLVAESAVMKATLASHSVSLGSIRDDARLERQERILLGQRVEDHIKDTKH